MSSRSILAFALAMFASGGLTPSAYGGGFCKWLFGCGSSEPAVPVGPPIPLGNGFGSVPGNQAGFPNYHAGFAPGFPAMGSQTMGFQTQGFSAPGFSSPGFASPSFSTPGFSTPSYSANFGNYFGAGMPAIGPSGAGYAAPVPGGVTAATLPSQSFPQAQPQSIQPQTMQPQTMQPQPMSFVPNFDSRSLRAPVTYFRPLMTTDPNTGAQVVAMAPCTSFQHLTQRVPTFGRSALFGSAQPPVFAPQPQTIPTFTLPSGGIPLAQGVPSITLPQTTAAFGQHSAFQPGLVAPGMSITPGTMQTSPGYATTPMGSSPYYSAPSGGSAGNIHSSTVPGLTAPQSSPYSAAPTSNFPAPGFSSPSISSPSMPAQISPAPLGSSPSTSVPQFPSNPVLPSSDPADLVPSLPDSDTYNGPRPQLRSIVPEVGGFGAESAANRSPSVDWPSAPEPTPEFPIMSPIPAPQGLERPRWSPGLLREGDMTALRPITRTADSYAGQSKKIVWASFEQPTGEEPPKKATESTAWEMDLLPSALDGAGGHSQPTVQPQIERSAPNLQTTKKGHSAGHSPTSRNPGSSGNAAPPSATRYENSGWKASR